MNTALIRFRNTTTLSSDKLTSLFYRYVRHWRISRLDIRVHFSRGADYSGTCFYDDRRIHVNLGRHVRFPYRLGTCIARSRRFRHHWARPIFHVTLPDAYQLALFIFLHELYHLLVRIARRNPRQKESMCDRFATRVLVDHHGAIVCAPSGEPVEREIWDFQDLDGFVASALEQPRHRVLVTRKKA